MHELIINLHMHTTYSDGSGSHADLARAALRSGLDAIIVTDHNIWVNGPEDYYRQGERKVLLMVGEEIHDQVRDPQKNHLLVFGAQRELATLASDPQRLIQAVNEAGGLAFIAHPVDPAAPSIGEGDLSWVDWDVSGFTGLELWNGFSEFKTVIKSKLHALYYLLRPKLINRGPLADTLQIWDKLTSSGERIVAIGGSDAHELQRKIGFWRVKIFPYEFHFQTVNTHILTQHPLQEDAAEDSQMILAALRQGHAFIGFDLPASTRGFRFTAKTREGTVTMGDEATCSGGVTFQIHLPLRTECHLLRNGKVAKTWQNNDSCTYITTEPGVYRVEAYVEYLGLRRGWIFSNPIYIR
jgi:hypothetical protein